MANDANITIREFARMIGKSHVWVLQLLREGKLPRNADGSLPMKAAMEAYTERLANPPPMGRPPKNGVRKDAMSKTKKAQKKDPKTQVADASPMSQLGDAVQINNAMTKAKLAEKTFQARLRELEYKLKSGELVEKVAVASEAEWLAEQVRSKLLAIPPRISVLCEGRVAREIEEIITDAINGALKELQKCKYTEG